MKTEQLITFYGPTEDDIFQAVAAIEIDEEDFEESVVIVNVSGKPAFELSDAVTDVTVALEEKGIKVPKYATFEFIYN